MKEGKYDFGEKFRDAKSSGMLDSNMGRVPAPQRAQSGRSSPHRPPEAGTTGPAWRLALCRSSGASQGHVTPLLSDAT
jgi:hypothetical protein